MVKLNQKIDIEKLFFQSATKIETHIVTITPEIAKRLLEQTNPNVQRKVTIGQVRQISTAITNGDFRCNGDTIRQDIEGNIIDGQHRLLAVIKAGKPIITNFTKGLATEVIHTIDIGNKTRSLADILEIAHQKKYKYANSISATSKFIINFNKGVYFKNGVKGERAYVTSTYFLEWMDNNPAIIDFVEVTMRLRANGDRVIAPAMFCGLKWILDRYNKEKSDIFFQQLSDGVGINRDSPIITLRKKIFSTKFATQGTHKINLSTTELIYIILRTWNAFVKGETLTYLKIVKDIPKILHK